MTFLLTVSFTAIHNDIMHDLHVVDNGFVSDDVMRGRGWHVSQREVLAEVVSLGGWYFSGRERILCGNHICKAESCDKGNWEINDVEG